MNKKKMIVTAIYGGLGIEQSVASQHLAILRRAQILKTEREGKFIHYKINYNRLRETGAVVATFLK